MSTTRAHHLYRGDGAVDFHGRDRCVHCGLPEHPRHQPPPATSDDYAATDARWLGEHEEPD